MFLTRGILVAAALSIFPSGVHRAPKTTLPSNVIIQTTLISKFPRKFHFVYVFDFEGVE